MATYVGETVEIANTGLDFNTTQLTPNEVAFVTIEIVDPSGGVVIDGSTVMLWDAERSLWFYLWDTSSLVAGTYQAKITMVGVTGIVSFAYLTIRLSAPKF